MKAPASPRDSTAITVRASQLFNQSCRLLAIRNDRLFARLIVFEWVVAIVLALFLTPVTYAGTQRSVHIHVYAAIFLGFATVSLPLILTYGAAGSALTRHVIAAAQLVMTGLLIDLTGGRIETHFLIFGSLAFLAFYGDWRILVTASVVTAADHILRGAILPRSIYGADVVNPWRWLEHAGYVVFEDIFLISSCLFGVNQRRGVCLRQAELEVTEAELRESREGLEITVETRTAELKIANRVLNIEIDERSRSETSLRRAEALLSGVLESSLDGVMAFAAVRDESGAIADFRWLLTNAAAERLVQKNHGELLGHLMLDVLPGNKVDGLFDAYTEVVETGRPLHIDHFYKHENLSLWVEISAVRLGDGFSVTFEDISVRKAYEVELKAAKETAEAATRTKSEFLANMSHEIRTPVTAMVGFADIMLDPGQTQSDRVDGLQTIRRNAKHLLDLINEILDLSKIEAGKMTVEQIATDLPPLLSDVMSIMRPRALEKGLALNLRFCGKIPRTVVTDPVRTKQILLNLLSNALKFTERGKVEILVSADPVLQVLNFEVTDSGIGIDPSQITELFQPFTQADGSTTRRFGGTGLGLTISKRFAQMLGGDISVKSTVGVGSSFTAQIAGAGDGSGERCLVEDALMVPQKESQAAFETIKGKVLLAEDGRDNQRFIMSMLRKAGLDVVLAENGRIAVERAITEQFDLILMDMQMPEMDGYAATSYLRGRGLTLPIIALTAHAMSEDRAKCINSGCTDYLTKPIDRKLFVETIGRHLKAATDVTTPDAGAAPPQLISAFAFDPDMADVLPEFIGNLSGEVAALRSLFEAKNLPELQNTVHQLKGAGGSYGYQELTEAASAAESTLKSGQSIESIAVQVEMLISLIRRVRGYRELVEVPNEH